MIFCINALLLRWNVGVGNMSCFLKDLSTQQLAVVSMEQQRTELTTQNFNGFSGIIKHGIHVEHE